MPELLDMALALFVLAGALFLGCVGLRLLREDKCSPPQPKEEEKKDE